MGGPVAAEEIERLKTLFRKHSGGGPEPAAGALGARPVRDAVDVQSARCLPLWGLFIHKYDLEYGI